MLIKTGFSIGSRLIALCLLALLTPAVHAQVTATLATNLPSAVDLRPAFTNWGLPLRQQGGRGTCSVFTLAGALEYALARASGTGTVLSVEFLNWASNDAIGSPADGGFFSDLWRGFAQHGICPEADWPYAPAYDADRRPTASALALAKQTADAALQLRWIKEWNVRTGLTDEQFLEIQRVLTRQWPVCGGLRWPKSERWREGVLAMAPPEKVFDGHSVLLVGFRDDAAQPGGGVFLIRNSGGGRADAALPYAYVRAYLNDAAWISPASH
jgi:hypothetical protein